MKTFNSWKFHQIIFLLLIYFLFSSRNFILTFKTWLCYYTFQPWTYVWKVKTYVYKLKLFYAFKVQICFMLHLKKIGDK